MALLFIPFYPAYLFFAFTFTDLIDFLPLFSLLIGMGGIGLVRCNKQTTLSPPLIALLFVLSLWPLLPHLGMLLLAQEFSYVQGYWPQVFIDDPHNAVGYVSPRYDAYHSSVVYLQAFAGAWMLVHPAFLIALRKRMSRKLLAVNLFVLFLALLFMVIDPGHVYAWWVD